jgi:hypothetical protein
MLFDGCDDIFEKADWYGLNFGIGRLCAEASPNIP